MRFSSTPTKVCSGTSNSYFRIKAPFFCCPLFCKEYLSPQVMVQEIVKEHSVDYHPSHSRIHCLMYLKNGCRIFSETCISHHGCWKFSNSWCSDYLEKHLPVKKLNLNIFSLSLFPRQNSAQGSYHHPPSRGKLLIPAKESFSENQFYQISKKRGEKETMIPRKILWVSKEARNNFYRYKFCCKRTFNIFKELISPFQTKCSKEKRKGILTWNKLTYSTYLSRQNSP